MWAGVLVSKEMIKGQTWWTDKRMIQQRAGFRTFKTVECINICWIKAFTLRKDNIARREKLRKYQALW